MCGKMIIEIPRVYVDILDRSVDPKTFAPIRNVLVNKEWVDRIREHHFIIKFDMDSTGFLEWVKDKSIESEYIDFRFVEGEQVCCDKILKNTLDHFEQTDSAPFRCEFIVEVIEKSKITLRDITEILSKRYREILEDRGGIDDKLGKLSNTNLLWMTDELLSNESIPYDKASRWIGFIQGCMAMKGYIDVDEERDFSREYFHEYYKQHGLSTKVLEKDK